MYCKIKWLFIFALFGVGFLLAQDAPFKEGELIIQLQKGVEASQIVSDFSSMGLRPQKLLSRRLNIWLFSYDKKSVEATDALYAVQMNPAVENVQFNHYVQMRSNFPNDPQFGNQWALHNTGQTGGTPDADIDAPEAWDFATGGTTVTGDEIVVAIIDGGFDLNHQDLSFWKNIHEIPNNGIDDDNNGYIDDYDGWNAYNSNGSIPVSNHGTHVAGIAAAQGNNGIGVSGVNWGAKVMPIAGSSGTESIVVEAYGYALEMRARFNETNGDSGAFVVVTNSSFGVDYGNPANFPIWCAMYDSMGAYGILSCAATANLNINVDIEGDVPTACPSDYLIAVTNTTHNDVKNSGAAYGPTTIDLGAPGTNILSTTPGNSYGNLSGTSMATPTVAGAVALLYTQAGPGLIQSYKNDPDQIALLFKDFILNGTDPISSLQNITVTGGRLNVYNSTLLVRAFADSLDPEPPSNFTAYSDYTMPYSMLLTWDDPIHYSGGDTLLPSDFTIEIERDGVWIQSVSGGVGQYTDSGLNDGQYYQYSIYAKVIATDSTSSKVDAGWTAGGDPQPSAPTGFYVTQSGSDLLMHWTNPSQNVDGTPMDDFAGINLYEDGSLAASFSRTSSDTARADSALYTPPAGTHQYYVTAYDNESPSNESDPSNTGYSPLAIPFFDDFPTPPDPNPGYWLNTTGEVTDVGVNPPSPAYVLTLDGHPSGGDVVELLPVDLSGYGGQGMIFSYWYQPQGSGNAPETGDSLIVEFKNDLG